MLLEAKAAGLAVDDSVLARIGGYLQRSLAERGPITAPVAVWYDSNDVRLSDRLMAVDYLSRAGLRDRAAENELLRLVGAARVGRPHPAGPRARPRRRPRGGPPAAGARVESGEGRRPRGHAAELEPPQLLLLFADPPRRVAVERHARGGSRAPARGPAGRDAAAAGPWHGLDVEHAGPGNRGVGAGGVHPPSEGRCRAGGPGGLWEQDDLRCRVAGRGRRDHASRSIGWPAADR